MREISLCVNNIKQLIVYLYYTQVDCTFIVFKQLSS